MKNESAVKQLKEFGIFREVHEWRIFTRSIATIVREGYDRHFVVELNSGSIGLRAQCPTPERAVEVLRYFEIKLAEIYREIGWPEYETGRA